MPTVRRVVSEDGASFWQPADQSWAPLWIERRCVAVLARELGLGAATPILLDGGYLNQIWLVPGRHVSRILRVGRSERTLEQVEYEERLLAEWSREIAAVVPIEQLVHDEVLTADRVVSIFPFREGAAGTEVPATLRAQQVAPVMAKMHHMAVALAMEPRPGAPGLADSPVGPLWDRVLSTIQGRFGSTGAITASLSTIAQAVDEIDRQVEQWSRSGRLRPTAAVHGDLNARNQIYRDGQLVGIIDADECRLDSLVSEVAGLAYSDPRRSSPSSVWQQYRDAGGPVPDSDEDLLLPLARQATLRELEWCITAEGRAHPRVVDMLIGIADALSWPTRG